MNKNKKMGYIGLMIIALVLVVSGISYAYFTATANSEQQVVTSGILELTYETGQDIQVDEMFPIEERNASLHKFTVNNTGTLEATYNISFIDIDLKKDNEDITARNLKWALYEADESYSEGDLVKSGSFSSSSGYLAGSDELVIKTGLTLASSTKQSYILKVWLQEAGKPQDEEQNINFSMKVQVDTLDKEESVGKVSILRERDGTYSTEMFYYYRFQIKKIVFQDQLNPIEESVAKWDVSENGDGYCMAYLVSNGEASNTTYTLYIQGNEVIYLSSGVSLFNSFTKLETIEGLEYVDTSQVTDMSNMFKQCSSLTSLDVTHFNTSQVTVMRSMFRECKSLTNLDLSNFDTSQVINMSYMFQECIGLNKLDLSSFNTSNVTDMTYMFFGCKNLINLDLSNADFTKVTNYQNMFLNVPSTIEVLVKDATAQAWIQSKLSGGTVIIA